MLLEVGFGSLATFTKFLKKLLERPSLIEEEG